MSTAIAEFSKGSGLQKSSKPVRELATRLERARQSRNEKIMRADADYVEAVRRALSSVEATEATEAAVDSTPVQVAS